MSQSEQIENTRLKPVTSSSQQLSRKNVHLLFIGLSAEEIAPLLALLRTPRISPRGRQIKSEKQFLTSLSERSWDMVICSPKEGKFKAVDALGHIKRLSKDLPVIQLLMEADSHKQLQALQNQITAIVPLDEKELLLHQVRKELVNLEKRRQLRKTRAALAKSEKLNFQLIENSKNAIACCTNNKITYANESFLDLFGEFKESQVLNRDITERFVEKDRDIIQSRLTELNQYNAGESAIDVTGLRTDQSEFHAHLDLATTVFNGEKSIRVSLTVDDHLIDKALNEDLNLISGLLNKDYLLRQLELIIQRSLSGGNDCSLLYIVLDNYEKLNSTVIPEHRDRYIREIGTTLNKTVKHPHILAQSENNAFVVIFLDSSPEKAQRFAEKICQQINQQEIAVGEDTLHSNCSIGIALINDNSPPPSDLLTNAESAAFEAQKDEHNAVTMFSATSSYELDDNEMKQVSKAVDSGNLKLLFQPVVNLTVEQPIAHYEVLLRLLGEEETEISPNDFRNAMSDPDTAIKVDRWVIENCISALKEAPGNTPKSNLIINLSAHCIENSELLTWLTDTLKDQKIEPEQLVFQLSNSDIAMVPKKARLFAKMIHDLNCKICIKHFGTAPYDKEVLKKVDADYIKLDGLFVQELGKDKNQDNQFFTLVKSLSEMDKITIAPLVEDSKTMVNLWKAGVSYVQGYYLQQPRHQMDYDFFAE
ncbi:MAG: EAL domain-containing protein [Neptuniibacter sp.]